MGPQDLSCDPECPTLKLALNVAYTVMHQDSQDDEVRHLNIHSEIDIFTCKALTISHQ